MDRHALSRRHFVAAAGSLLVLPLAACGGDDDGATSTAAQTGAGDRFPVTITHKFGRTEIPSAPQRVVAVGYNDQDFALALGVEPLGFRQFQDTDISARPWAQAALGGAKPKLVGETDVKFESIAALKPDLILAVYSGITDADYGKLARIAPTVAQSADYVDYGEPWDVQLRTTGQALGRSGEAAKVAKDVERAIAAARGSIDAQGASVAMGSGTGGKFYAYASADLRARQLVDLGLKVPAEIDRLAGKQFYADVSEERLDLLDRDLLVIYGDERELTARPTFARLKAVREGRVVYLDEQAPIAQAIGFSSPLSIPWVLERLTPRIKAALDGDPATKVEGTGPDAA
ncbi:ABC transporter substrate-binding protein [Patulibacter sp. S7RM1-6]